MFPLVNANIYFFSVFYEQNQINTSKKGVPAAFATCTPLIFALLKAFMPYIELYFFGNRLFFAHFQGSVAEAEYHGYDGRDYPADGPRSPYAVGAEQPREHIGEDHADREVGEGGNHKLRHETRAAEYAVGNELQGYHEIKRRNYFQKQRRSAERGVGRSVEEDIRKLLAEEEIQHKHRYAKRPDKLCPRKEAAPYALMLYGSYIRAV